MNRQKKLRINDDLKKLMDPTSCRLSTQEIGLSEGMTDLWINRG